MKSKITFILALAVMVFLAAGSVWAGVINVDVNDPSCVFGSGQADPYSVVYCSIQDAIDDASSGDVINVAAGTYIEAVKVDKSITLQGLDGAIIRPDNTTPTWDKNRRCGVYIAAVDNVTIDGFEIDGTGGTVHLGIFPSNSNNTVVKNNVIHDITNEIGSPGNDKAGLGILFFGWGQGIDNAVIENNTVYHTGRMGIIVCAMNAVTYKWELCNNNVIRNNVVHDAWQGPTEDYGGAIQINGAMNSSIEGNTIFDTGKPTDYWLYTGIHICGSAASSTPNRIEGNDIFDNYIGIVIRSDDSGVNFGTNVPGAPEVHCNNIYNSTFLGMLNRSWRPGYEVDGTCNWWGHASGPYHPTGNPSGMGDRVSNYVDYNPWLMAPTISWVINDILVKVTHLGIANSLIFQLQNALNAQEHGNTKAFEKILNAFIRTVKSQSGKKISAEYAGVLIGWAGLWIDNPQCL